MSQIGFLLFVFLTAASTGTVTANTLSPSCKAKCGGIDIPYPFGIGEGCYAKEYGDFSISCTDDSTAYLSDGYLTDSSNIVHNRSIELVDVSLTGELRIKGSTGYDCFDPSGNRNNWDRPSVDLGDLPYTFSHTRNKFVVIGCDTNAFIQDQYGVRYAGGCISYCTSLDSFKGTPNGSCSGLGCCEVSIPRGIKNYTTGMDTYYKYSYTNGFNRCGFSFLAEQDQYTFSYSDLNSTKLKNQALPVVLDWSIGSQNCAEAKNNLTVPYLCSDNSKCIESNNGVGYRCNCSEGYRGNPYLKGGCEDINECEQIPSVCPSNADCTNTAGGHNCTCRAGYRNFSGMCEGKTSAIPAAKGSRAGGIGKISGGMTNPLKSQLPIGRMILSGSSFPILTCHIHENVEIDKSRSGDISLALKLVLGLCGGLLVILSASAVTWSECQRRNVADQRRKVAYFKQRMFEHNGGPLLQQHISSQPGNTFRIFTEEDLAKATSGFADDQIIGRGGHGVVYLGRLEGDTAVAVKRSKMMDERESKEFAREMAILSQINHVNVVKILGCCVEVEVPMLVYEFVPGGTLFDLIHRRNERTPISLEVRLRIATEVAEALAYLHSYASPPILHKDVKVSNILLDENYRAKISDFGASSFAPLDETDIATVVQGTCGYLDPEYLQTYQFSEKSDVYSFGVVLVELLTRRKPLHLQGPVDERGLAVSFVSLLNQGKLENILDPQVLAEGDAERLTEIAELAGRCLSVKGADRPTMKEVSMALHVLGPSREHPWVPQHTPEEAESLLSPEQTTAYDSAGVASGYLSRRNHTILEIEAGR